VTRDGVAVRLEANVALPEDVERALAVGAAGVGLYRSEYLLAGSTIDALTEDEQFEAYRRIVGGMAPAPVTIRTFDAREDQIHGRTIDPARGPRGRLGLQAIRVSLAFRDLFRRQLRALLRAARHGHLRIMFPFVSGVDELREARVVVSEARADLRETGGAPDVPIGVMIEVPSAALTADLLAREADFLSIGTNDLIQCCLAVDRTDERVSHLYQPMHPAVFRLMRLVQRAGRHAGKPVAVCGEMAADPVHLVLLIGIGLTEFSMRPAAIPLARQIIGTIRVRDAQRFAARLMRGESPAEVEEELARRVMEADGAPAEYPR
jgi:phosphotransferase system enzyme I (PtsI)